MATVQISDELARRRRRDEMRRQARSRFPRGFRTGQLATYLGLSYAEADDLVRLWRDLYVERRGSYFAVHGYWWEWR